MSASTKTPPTAMTGCLAPIDKAGLDDLIAKGKENPQAIKTLKCRTIAEGRFRHLNMIRNLPPYVVDEPPGLLGDDTAPNPSEASLAALGSCLAVGIHANAVARGITIPRSSWSSRRTSTSPRSGAPATSRPSRSASMPSGSRSTSTPTRRRRTLDALIAHAPYGRRWPTPSPSRSLSAVDGRLMDRAAALACSPHGPALPAAPISPPSARSRRRLAPDVERIDRDGSTPRRAARARARRAPMPAISAPHRLPRRTSPLPSPTWRRSARPACPPASASGARTRAAGIWRTRQHRAARAAAGRHRRRVGAGRHRACPTRSRRSPASNRSGCAAPGSRAASASPGCCHGSPTSATATGSAASSRTRTSRAIA